MEPENLVLEKSGQFDLDYRFKVQNLVWRVHVGLRVDSPSGSGGGGAFCIAEFQRPCLPQYWKHDFKHLDGNLVNRLVAVYRTLVALKPQLSHHKVDDRLARFLSFEQHPMHSAANGHFHPVALRQCHHGAASIHAFGHCS
jgi:hypothetical protein